MSEKFDAKAFVRRVRAGEYTARYEVWCTANELGELLTEICSQAGVRLSTVKVQAYKPWSKKGSRPLEFGVSWEVVVNGPAEDDQ